MERTKTVGRRVRSWAPDGAGMRWIALGMGMLLCVGLALPMRTAWTPGPPEVWVADRDGGSVVGLDAGLFPARAVAARFPVRVAPRAGGVWAATAEAGFPLGEHTVAAWDAALGWRTLAAGLGPLVDLEAGVDGAALCVEFGLGGQPARVVRVNEAGAFDVTAHAGALAVCGWSGAGGAAELLVAGADGRVVRYGPGGRVLGAVVVGGELVDVAVQGSGAGARIVVLDAIGAFAGPGPWAEGARVVVLEPGLLGAASAADPFESGGAVEFAVGLGAGELGLVPDAEAVWVADASEPLARRFGLDGALEAEVVLPASDVGAVAGLPGGGALFATPGAVLRVDGMGQVQPGQGGFGFLTDVCVGGG